MRSTSATHVSFLGPCKILLDLLHSRTSFCSSKALTSVEGIVRAVCTRGCTTPGWSLTYHYRPWSQVYCSIAVRVLDLKPTKRCTLPAASTGKLQALASKYEYLSDIQRAKISVIAPKAVKPVPAVPLSKAMPIMPINARQHPSLPSLVG